MYQRNVINLGKVVDSGPPPSVAITSHSDGSEVANDLVTLQATVTDNGKGVGRVEWRVNGVTAAVLAKKPDPGPAHILRRTLALDPGPNTIEVVAYNAANLLASIPACTKIKSAGARIP